MSTINCLDLKGQHQQIKKEVFELFEKVYENTAFSGGPFVEQLKKIFQIMHKPNILLVSITELLLCI